MRIVTFIKWAAAFNIFAACRHRFAKLHFCLCGTQTERANAGQSGCQRAALYLFIHSNGEQQKFGAMQAHIKSKPTRIFSFCVRATGQLLASVEFCSLFPLPNHAIRFMIGAMRGGHNTNTPQAFWLHACTKGVRENNWQKCERTERGAKGKTRRAHCVLLFRCWSRFVLYVRLRLV